MKLKRHNLETVARERGYKSGYDLLIELGCENGAYFSMSRSGKVDPALAAEIFNRLGEEAMFDLIDFGDEKDERKARKNHAQ